MFKPIIFILLFISSSLFGQSVYKRTYKEKRFLNSFITHIHEFNRDGTLRRDIRCYDYTCTLRNVNTYTYDNNKRIVSTSYYSYDEKGMADLKYYKRNKCLKNQNLNDSIYKKCLEKFIYPNIYSHTKNLQLLGIYKKDITGVLGNRIYPYESVHGSFENEKWLYGTTEEFIDYPATVRNEYDIKGNLISNNIYHDELKNSYHITEYIYDNQNRIIEKKSKSKSSHKLGIIKKKPYLLTDSIVYKWDNDRIKYEINYHSDSFVENPKLSTVLIKYKYNNFGLLKSEQHYYLKPKNKKKRFKKIVVEYEYYRE